MQRQIRFLGVALGAMFALLFAALNWTQVFHASALVNNPANAKRLIVEQSKIKRGDILAGDEQTVLAESIRTRGELKFERRYLEAERYAYVTGYFSLVLGSFTRLEASYNDFLGARATELVGTTIVDEILGRPKRGATVVTTIDPRLQQAAWDALGDQQGAVVALNPRTGDVLAMVSKPSYNPNPLSSNDPDEARRAYHHLQPNDPSTRLLSNASDQLFAPGSTFKLVDLAAALQAGMTPATEIPNPPSLDLPQTTHRLHNFGNEHCAGGAATITLEQALVESCNVAFAQVGLELGANALYQQSRAFGFDQDVPFDMPFAEGRFPPPSEFEDRLPAVAFSAIGQQDVGANPLQMALIAAAVANGGVEMTPHLVREIRDPNGVVVKSFGPEAWGRPIPPDVAATMTELMEKVVEEGTGTAAQIPGVAVAGKTGTAETSSGEPHAWFTAFAPAGNPRIAVAVVVLHGGSLASEATGGEVAAPIARAVIEAALGRGG